MSEWFERWFYERFLVGVLVVCLSVGLVCFVVFSFSLVGSIYGRYEGVGEEDPVFHKGAGEEDPVFHKCAVVKIRSCPYGDVVRVGDEYLFLGDKGIVKLQIGEEE